MPTLIAPHRGVLDVDRAAPLNHGSPWARNLILCLIGLPGSLSPRNISANHGTWVDRAPWHANGQFQALNGTGPSSLVTSHMSLPVGLGAFSLLGVSNNKYLTSTLARDLDGASRMTIAAWIRADALTTVGTNPDFIVNWQNATGQSGVDIRQVQGNIRATVRTAGGTLLGAIPVALPDATHFHRWILTYGNGTASLYLDGQLGNSNNFGGTTINNAFHYLVLGEVVGGSVRVAWHGDIAAILTWRDRTLTAGEVVALDQEMVAGFPTLLRHTPSRAAWHAVITLFGAAVPGTPTLLSPVNGASDVVRNPTVTWSSVSGATSYDIQVDDDAGFSSPVVNVTGVSDTSYDVLTLLNTGTTYYWRVRAVNAAGNGAWATAFSFTTTLGSALTGIGMGYLVRAGFVREALLYAPTWPSANVSQVTELIHLLDEDLHEIQTLAPGYRRGDPSTRRSSGPHALRLQRRETSGQLRFHAHHGQTLLWAMALGYMAKRISGTVMPESLGGGAYRHLYEIDASLGARPWQAGDGWIASDGLLAGQRKVRRLTVAVSKGVNAWESKSCMVDTLTLDAVPNAVTMSLRLRGYSLEHIPALNTAIHLSTLASDPLQELRFYTMQCLLAPFSTSTALDSGDELSPASLSLTVANNLESTARRTVAPYPGEFERRAPAVVTGTLLPGRYTTTAQLRQLQAASTLMMLISFTGNAIGSSGYNTQLDLYLPRVRLTAAEVPTRGPQLHQPRYMIEALQPATTPAGFPASITASPLLVRMTTTRDTHPLL